MFTFCMLLYSTPPPIFDRANVTVGVKEDRMMMTGLHTVADIFCVGCGSIVGWKYETAHEKNQKYKEGKSVLERSVDITSKKSSFCKKVYSVYKKKNTKNGRKEKKRGLRWVFWLSRFKISGPDGSYYWANHEAHVGGSDADDV
ncbi:hypothetical protein F0562_026278 [Nyssa sinensis]|uniref:Protein yippee-like n=1 Tax=Nyssa sinensis TaxID=561372 RepID=A0A5J5BB14_9ASTE|nr:hypothetical protein F0562_026278 [Nyssa sinensis]